MADPRENPITDPAPLERFEAFPFGVVRFDFVAFERTDGIEPVVVRVEPADEPTRF